MGDNSNRNLNLSTREDLLRTHEGLEHKDVSVGEGVADALHAAAYSGLQKPVEGVVQLVNHVTSSNMKAPEMVSRLDHENAYTQAGSMVGAVADFYALSKGVGATRQALGRAASVPLMEAGTTGALYELAMPTADKDFASNKLRSMAVGFGTFATMDGVAGKLRNGSFIRNADTFWGSVEVGGVSGMAGGFAHGMIDAGMQGKLPNYYDVGYDMAQFGTFGAIFGGVEGGVKAGTKAANDLSSLIKERAASGEPLVSVGPIEIHPRGFAERARDAQFTDGLTGLKNKAFGEEALRAEANRSHREGEPLSMTFLDLDNFKAVNDKIGHAHGDEVLKEVSSTMTEHFRRDTDVHIREGGDEFMVLMPNTELASAGEVAGAYENSMRIGASKEPVTAQRLAENFPGELQKLKTLDRSESTEAGDTLWNVAERLLQKRNSVTGEAISEQTLAAEVKRLSERTGIDENVPLGNGSLAVYSDADIVAFGEKAAFRFTPQIGQMFKMRGVATEPQIQEILSEQASAKGEKPLFGELLVKKGYATREQVDEVFGEQKAIRSNLRNMADEALNTSGLVPRMSAQFPLPDALSTPLQIARFRSLIPDVPRPWLSPNGVRRLALGEPPVTGEVVVGVSTGVVELARGEPSAEFKTRGDHMMYEKKLERKRMGLRHERGEEPVATAAATGAAEAPEAPDLKRAGTV
jgi:diguanylate cyclase (GGDEF)-like protein